MNVTQQERHINVSLGTRQVRRERLLRHGIARRVNGLTVNLPGFIAEGRPIFVYRRIARDSALVNRSSENNQRFAP